MENDPTSTVLPENLDKNGDTKVKYIYIGTVHAFVVCGWSGYTVEM